MIGRLTRWHSRRPAGRKAPSRAAGPADAGNAIVEFVFVGLLVMIPLIYFLLAVFDLQRNTFAVTQAAREAGRAYATADDEDSARVRARYAVDLALADQHVSPADVRLTYLPAGASCGSSSTGDAASLRPGAEFTVCVSRSIVVPGVPSILDAHRNTVTGRFVVHVDDYRSTS